MQSCCVIGCGPAGITASAHLRQAGLLVTCFELHSVPGGIWQIDSHESFSSRGLYSPIYPTMKCIIPKDVMAFSDFRFDYTVPQFPHHSSVKNYLEHYASSKGVAALCRFNTQVQSARFDLRDGLWKIVTVNVSNGDVLEWAFHKVCVCTGQTQEPRFPKKIHLLAESFKEAGGDIEHACYIKNFRSYRSKKVVVIGDGVTAAEYCNGLHQAGADVYHSSSTGGSIAASTKNWSWSRLPELLKRNTKKRGTADLIKHLQSAATRRAFFSHPINHIGSLVRCEGRDLIFKSCGSMPLKISSQPFSEDSEELIENVDMIICATGYTQRYTFLSPDVRNVVEESHVERISDGKKAEPQLSKEEKEEENPEKTSLTSTRGLYLGTIYRENPSLAFVGMQAGLIPSFMMFECQSRFVSYVFSERVSLPSDSCSMIEKEQSLETSFQMDLSVSNGQCNTPQYFNVLQQELGVSAQDTYFKKISQRRRWLFVSSFLRVYHKFRSLAPLKRKQQHILFSNKI